MALIKFYKTGEKWVLGNYDGYPAGTCVRYIDPTSGVIYIRPANAPGNSDKAIEKGLPTQFCNEGGTAYADLAAFKAATDDFFVKASSASLTFADEATVIAGTNETAPVNSRGVLAGFLSWVVNKTFAGFNTNSKTIQGAINEINLSKASKVNGKVPAEELPSSLGVGAIDQNVGNSKTVAMSQKSSTDFFLQKSSEFTDLFANDNKLIAWNDLHIYNSSGVLTSTADTAKCAEIDLTPYIGTTIRFYAWWGSPSYTMVVDDTDAIIQSFSRINIGQYVDYPVVRSSKLRISHWYGAASTELPFLLTKKRIKANVSESSNDISSLNNTFINVYDRTLNIATFTAGSEYNSSGVLVANSGGSYCELDVTNYQGKKLLAKTFNGSPYFNVFKDAIGNVISYASIQAETEVSIPANATKWLLSNYYSSGIGVQSPYVYAKATTLTKAIQNDESAIKSSAVNVSTLVSTNNFNLATFDWTSTIQSVIDAGKTVYLPYRLNPYLVSNTIIMKSNIRIIADRNAVIKNDKGLFILNQHILPSDFSTRDFNISIDGGIWDLNSKYGSTKTGNTTIDTGVRASIAFLGVNNLELKNMIVRNGSLFAFQINDIERLIIDNVKFETCARDGIHLGGNINNFSISNIYGVTNDDMIALNAWDWYNCTPKLGNITNGVIRNIHQISGDNRCIRILGALVGGTKYIVDNVVIDGVFSNNVSENITIGFEYDSNTAGTATKHGKIAVKNIVAKNTSLSYPAIGITSDVSELIIENASLQSARCGIEIKSGVTVGKLSLRDYSQDYNTVVSGYNNNLNVYGAITKLIVDGLRNVNSSVISGGKSIYIGSGAFISAATFTNCYFGANEFALYSDKSGNTAVKTFACDFVNTKSSGNITFTDY